MDQFLEFLEKCEILPRAYTIYKDYIFIFTVFDDPKLNSLFIGEAVQNKLRVFPLSDLDYLVFKEGMLEYETI